MSKVQIGEKHNPSTAKFWGRFPTEMAQPERRCATVALYETDGGEFFAVEQGRTASGNEISATVAILVPDPDRWLDERMKFLTASLP
ncbi:MAG: hypothetical protein ACFCUT_02450 [Kiloniellaceae bacterium]